MAPGMDQPVRGNFGGIYASVVSTVEVPKNLNTKEDKNIEVIYDELLQNIDKLKKNNYDHLLIEDSQMLSSSRNHGLNIDNQMNSEDIDQLFSKKITMKEIDKYLTENQMDFNGNFEMPE